MVRSLIAVITTLSEQIKALQGQVDAHFSQHPDAEINRSQPGLGPVLGARVLAEFGDDPARYASAKARKNYAATSPITRQSGKRKAAELAADDVHGELLAIIPAATWSRIRLAGLDHAALVVAEHRGVAALYALIGQGGAFTEGW